MNHTETTSRDELIDVLTEDALKASSWSPRPRYDPNEDYSVPLYNPKWSHHNNWDNNWIPKHTIKFIRSADSIPKGISHVAEQVIDKYSEVSGKDMDMSEKVGVYQIVSARWGIGAVGEEFHKTNLIREGIKVYKLSGENDVENKIDVHSDAGKDQVKTTATKPYNIPGKANRLVWVKIKDNGLTTEIVKTE